MKSGQCIRVLNDQAHVTCLEKISNIQILSGLTVKLWNVDSGECSREFNIHESGVRCFQMFSNETILSGSWDQTIKLWNFNSGTCLHTLKGHANRVNNVKILS